MLYTQTAEFDRAQRDEKLSARQNEDSHMQVSCIRVMVRSPSGRSPIYVSVSYDSGFPGSPNQHTTIVRRKALLWLLGGVELPWNRAHTVG
jgi:hypothetical protein